MRSIRSCHRAVAIYTRQVRLSWKFLRLVLLAALPLAVTGCGGINASKTVSPLDFFLPGLIKNDAPAKAPVLPVGTSPELAIVR